MLNNKKVKNASSIEIDGINFNANEIEPIYIGSEYEDGDLSLYIQNGEWLDLILSGGRGDLPASKTIHFYDGKLHHEIYGVYPSSYEFTVEGQKLAEQKVDVKCFKSIPNATALEKVQFLHPKTFPVAKGISGAIVVSGETLNYTEFKFKVELETKGDLEIINSEYIHEPVISKRKIESEITFLNKSSGFITKSLINSPQYMNLDFSFGAVDKSITGMYISDINYEEIPQSEDAIYKYTMILKQGSGLIIN